MPTGFNLRRWGSSVREVVGEKTEKTESRLAFHSELENEMSRPTYYFARPPPPGPRMLI